MPTRCNRGFYCRSYSLLNMFRARLCPSSGAQELLRVVFCAVSFSSSWSGVELRVMRPVCRMLQHPANRHFISTYIGCCWMNILVLFVLEKFLNTKTYFCNCATTLISKDVFLTVMNMNSVTIIDSEADNACGRSSTKYCKIHSILFRFSHNINLNVYFI